MDIQDTKPTTAKSALPLFLAGTAIGAVAGILLAPDSGKETQRRLGEWIKEKGEKGKEAFLARKHGARNEERVIRREMAGV